jgi:hypothetical protein
MDKKFVIVLAGIAFIGGATTLLAQDGAKPANVGEGTMMLQDKNYSLTHSVAYETTINEEEVIAVVLSGQTISSEKLKEAKETEKDSGFAGRRQGDRGTQGAGRQGKWQSQSAEGHRRNVCHGL